MKIRKMISLIVFLFVILTIPGEKIVIADTNQSDVTYVETWGNDSTAVVGQIAKPFKTVNSALDALPSTGGIIKIGWGTFAPIDYTKWKDNVVLMGAQRPVLNASGSALINGTIIQGYTKIVNHNNFTIKDIGFDNGLDYCNNSNFGNADNAFACGSTDVTNPLKGININNIICLVKDPYVAFHSCLIECVTGAVIDNIETHFGTHGFVLKGTNSTVDNITTWDSATDGVIIRANSYAECNSNIFKNITISSTFNNTGGLILDGDENGVNLYDIKIDNIKIMGTSFGIKFYGSDTGTVSQININNVILDNIQGTAIETIGVCSKINIDNVIGTELKGNKIVQSVKADRLNITNSNLE